jgi:hypothetical protein
MISGKYIKMAELESDGLSSSGRSTRSNAIRRKKRKTRNERRKKCSYALFWASYLGHADVVEALLSRGATVNVMDEVSNEPVFLLIDCLRMDEHPFVGPWKILSWTTCGVLTS